MKKPRIMVVCGFGLGSSMILKLKLDSVLKAHGVKADTFCADTMTGVGQDYDIVFTSKELLNFFKNSSKPVVVISNFLSEQEIEEKGLPVVRQLIGE